MRILLDACVPERLGWFIAGHNVRTMRAAFGKTDFDDRPVLEAIIDHLVPLVPQMLTALKAMNPGDLRVVGA